jgi:hypothetical protein
MIAGFFCCTQTEMIISAPCCSIAVFKLGQTCSPNQYYYPSAKLGRYSIGFLHHDFLLNNSQLELTLIPSRNKWCKPKFYHATEMSTFKQQIEEFLLVEKCFSDLD